MITKLLVSMIMAVPTLLLMQDPLLAQVRVKVAPVVLLSNEPLRTYAGTVEPFQNVTIQSKVAGRIVGIKVDENQRVKKGEVLLSLENTVTNFMSNYRNCRFPLAKIRLRKPGKLWKTVGKGSVKNKRCTIVEPQQDKDWIP